MRNEKGSILLVCMLLLLMVTLLAVAAMQTGSFGNRIAGNNLEGMKAFWIAEAGLQDAKDKFSTKNLPERSGPVDYAEGSYTITASFPDIADPTRKALVRSVGEYPGGKKTVEATLKRFTLDLPGPLYSKSLVSVHGAQTTIIGNDPCGEHNKPAIVTTQDKIAFQTGRLWGNGKGPVVDKDGVPSVTRTGSPTEEYDLFQLITLYRNYATIESTEQSIQGTSPVVANWGGDNIITHADSLDEFGNKVPQNITLNNPNSTPNVIYLDPPEKVNPDNTRKKEVTLTNVMGHGLLLINGSANISGGFSWYGVIIASGGLKFSGVGGEGKNITGGVMAGQAIDLEKDTEVNLQGSIAIIYCSKVKNYLDGLNVVQMISWREVKGKVKDE